MATLTRYKIYEDSNFQAGDSPVMLDINADMGQNANIGYISCDGAGDILIELSEDGAGYGEQFTIKTGETFSWDRMSFDLGIDTIKITHSGTDSAYRIFAR